MKTTKYLVQLLDLSFYSSTYDDLIFFFTSRFVYFKLI